MATAAVRERVRALVLQHGAAASCYQVLDTGVRHWCDDDRAVGYAVAGRTWIAAGSPLTAGDLGAAARAFAAAATASGARALFFLAEAPLVRALGPPAAHVCIGAQPVAAPGELAAEFRRHRSLRMQLHRAANKGVAAAEWTAAEAAGSIELAQALIHWLGTRRSPPLRFLAGPSLLPDLRDRRVFVARRHGVPAAYLLLAPIPRRRGWLVEQIVRGRHSCNGVSEALLWAATQAVAHEGADMLTLGLAPLTRNAAPPRGRLRPLLALARRWGRRWYDFDGVEAFKAKFRMTTWEPLFLSSLHGAVRVRDLWALARVEAGGRPLHFVLQSLRRRR